MRAARVLINVKIMNYARVMWLALEKQENLLPNSIQ